MNLIPDVINFGLNSKYTRNSFNFANHFDGTTEAGQLQKHGLERQTDLCRKTGFILQDFINILNNAQGTGRTAQVPVK